MRAGIDQSNTWFHRRRRPGNSGAWVRRAVAAVLAVAVLSTIINLPRARAGASVEPQDVADMIAALQRFDRFSQALATVDRLGEALPGVDVVPGGDQGLKFFDLVAKAVTSRFGAAPASLVELASSISTGTTQLSLGDGRAVTVTATAGAATAPATVESLHLVINANRHVGAARLSLASTAPLVSLQAEAAAGVDLSLNVDVVFGYDTATRTAWLVSDAAGPKVQVAAKATLGGSASAGLGILKVSVAPPVSDPALSVDVHLAASIADPDGDGRITIVNPDATGALVGGELAAGLVKAGFDPATKSTMSGGVQITADTAMFPALGTISGTVTVRADDLASGATPSVTATGLDPAVAFEQLNPRDLAGALSRVAAVLDALQTTRLPGSGAAVTGDVDLPFIKGRLSDALKVSDALNSFVSQYVNPSDPSLPAALQGEPKFASIQDLAADVKAFSDSHNIPGGQISLTSPGFDPASSKVVLELKATASPPPAKLDSAGHPASGTVALGSALQALGGVTAAAAAVPSATVSPSFALDIPVAVDLGPARSGAACQRNPAPTPADPSNPSNLACPYTLTGPTGSAETVTQLPRAADRIMVRTGGSPVLVADLPMTASVDATASAGPLTLHLGGSVKLDPPASGHMISVGLKATGDAQGDLRLSELFSRLHDNPGDLLALSGGGRAKASLGVDVPGLPDLLGANAACANETVTGCVDVTADLPDITNPSALTVTGPNLAKLKAFDLSGDPAAIVAKVRAALTVLSGALKKIPDLAGANTALNTALTTPMPVIGKSLNDLVNTDTLDTALASVASANLPHTLQDAVNVLNTSMGSNVLHFSVATTASGASILAAHVTYHQGLDRNLPLSFSFPFGSATTTVAGASSDGQVHLTGAADADVTLALPIDGTPGPHDPTGLSVLPASKVSVAGTVDGSGHLSASLGPLVVALGAPPSTGLTDPAEFHAKVGVTVADTSDTGTDPIPWATWVSHLAPAFDTASAPVTCATGDDAYRLAICARLPAYVSNDGGQTFKVLQPTGTTSANHAFILRLPQSDPLSLGGPDLAAGVPRLQSPDNLVQAITDAVVSFDVLGAGAKQLLALIGKGLSAAANAKLPFVSDALAQAQRTLDDLTTKLNDALAALPNPAAATAAAMKTAVQTNLTNALGTLAQGPVTVTVRCGNVDCPATDSNGQPTSALTITELRVSLDVGSEQPGADACPNPGCLSTALNLGIPGLQLKGADATSTLNARLGWHLHLGLGLSTDPAKGVFLLPGTKLSVGVAVDLPPSLAATLGFIHVALTDTNGGTVPAFAGTFTVDLTNSADLPAAQLAQADPNLVRFALTAHAKTDWHLDATADKTLPGLGADFHFDWAWANTDPSATTPTVRLDNIVLDPGKVLAGLLGPIATKVNDTLAPFRPLLDSLDKPIPVLSDLSHDTGGGDVTLRSLLRFASGNDATLTMVDRALNAITLVDRVGKGVAAASHAPLSLGSFDINSAAALADADPSVLVTNANAAANVLTNLAGGMFPAGTPASDGAQLVTDSSKGGLTFPVFDNPTSLFGLLLGQTVDLVRYDAGDLGIHLTVDLSFPILPFPPVVVSVSGSVAFKAHLSGGFDTFGIQEAFKTGRPVSVLDGLFLDTRDRAGHEVPQLELGGTIRASAGVDLVLVKASVGGGVTLAASLSLNDADHDGKFRASELASAVGCLFNARASSTAFLYASVTVGWGPFSKELDFDVARVPLFDVSRNCPADSRSGGFSGIGSWPSLPPPPPPPYLRKKLLNDNGVYQNATFNSFGDVAATSKDSFTAKVDGVMIPVGGPPQALNAAPPGGSAAVYGFNDGREFVGARSLNPTNPKDHPTAFVGGPNGIQSIPGVPTDVNSEAFAVANDSCAANSAVRIAGGEVDGRAAVFTNNGYTDIQPDNSGSGQVNAVNDVGDAVGTYETGTNPVWHAFYYHASFFTDLSDLIPQGSPFASLDTATGMNRKGQIVGFGTVKTPAPHEEGFLYDNDQGVLVDTGLGGGSNVDSSGNIAINDAGTVVGTLGGVQGGDTRIGISRNGQLLPEGTIKWAIPAALSQAGDVAAHDEGGVGLYSPNIPVLRTGTLPTRRMPSAPSGLTASATGGGVAVSWDPPKLVGGGLTTYRLYRFQDPRHLEPVADVGCGATTYTDRAASAGQYHYLVSAANIAGEGPVTVSGAVAVTGTAAPAFTADTPPTAATAGSAYSYTFAATGNPAPTFSLASGTLPTGVNLNATTGVLSGTPMAGGPFTFAVKATNGVGPDAVSPSITIIVTGPNVKPIADFDGDGKTDVAVFRPSTGTWYIQLSGGGTTTTSWGTAGDIAVPGDYNGDGKTDLAVFRPSTGAWYIQNSGGAISATNWGAKGDIPVPGDYNGDGKTDLAVFRPSNGTWYIQLSGGGASAVNWGTSGDIPVPGDYNGDGKTDVAVFRPSTGTWYIQLSGGGTTAVNWGTNGDVPVPGDYNGDGKTDVATFRPSTGTWYVNQTGSDSGASTDWGISGDIPVPGDYNGDGKTDLAVFRPSTGTWHTQLSRGGVTATNWGTIGDSPIGQPPGT